MIHVGKQLFIAEEKQVTLYKTSQSTMQNEKPVEFTRYNEL